MPTETSFAALINGFVSGRLSYDKLSRQLRTLAGSSPGSLPDARQTIRTFVEEGRLPQDLGQILLNQLPDQPQAPVEDATQRTDSEITAPTSPAASPRRTDEEFDEPTLPHALSGPAPELPVAHKEPADPGPEEGVPPAGQPVSPQLPPLPFLTQTTEQDGGDMRGKVDDAILTSLVSGYADYRQKRAVTGEPQAGQEDSGKLDKFLTNFRSARFRSDARRAAGGRQGEGLDFNKLATPRIKRAGVGSILRDRFILDTEIGRGGMGYVYSAVDRRRLEAGHDQPYVAVKLLNENFHNDSEALRLLEAEARKSQILAHPNITTVHDFDRDKADVFIVMELLKGTGLDRRLGRSMGQPLPTGECARILRGMCAGLGYAHSRGVVHSDLKPGNIHLLEDGTVKLLDFGLAAAASASADHPIQDSLTAAYASPEQFERAPRDPRDDVFALGCITYQVLTGGHPFSSRPISDVAREGLAAHPIDGLDPQAWDTLQKALCFDRDKRLPDVASFLTGIFEETSD
ncbi:serine/threonine-protein kinase [Roseibium marinum]|uniref:serine/threonine-protein kinase n=1 Tax=Roseibium marinum TaxID=281252 RepID=UPI000CCFFDF8|nr:serine/threonine-protein kinase [Roseibium marinum]